MVSTLTEHCVKLGLLQDTVCQQSTMRPYTSLGQCLGQVIRLSSCMYVTISSFVTPGYGASPREKISHRTTPNDQLEINGNDVWRSFYGIVIGKSDSSSKHGSLLEKFQGKFCILYNLLGIVLSVSIRSPSSISV